MDTLLPSKDPTIQALNIIIGKLDEEKIFTKKQMLDVINKYSLKIIFTSGQWNTKFRKYCITSDNKRFENMCLAGLYNGEDTINILNKLSISQSAFAHELLHYFTDHINNSKCKKIKDNKLDCHEDKEFWKKFVGDIYLSDKGILNEELKKAGL